MSAKTLSPILMLSLLLTACSTGPRPSSGQLLAQSCCAAKAGTEATCTGSKSCNACKNCKYCKHCAKEGGSCGVCK